MFLIKYLVTFIFMGHFFTFQALVLDRHHIEVSGISSKVTLTVTDKCSPHSHSVGGPEETEGPDPPACAQSQPQRGSQLGSAKHSSYCVASSSAPSANS